MYEIRFPNLGIVLSNVKDGFMIGNFEIRFYGMIIALGFILAYLVMAGEAKRTKQDPELYLDFMLWLVIPAILEARIYYVLFSLDDYIKEGQSIGQTIKGMLNIRAGGLAIYGGVIAGIITVIVFSKKRKVSTMLMLDTISMGMLVGQIFGRWGNFFNREAFGEYTDSLLAMAIPAEWFGGKNYLVGKGADGIMSRCLMVRNLFRCILHFYMSRYGILWCYWLSFYTEDTRSLMEKCLQCISGDMDLEEYGSKV